MEPSSGLEELGWAVWRGYGVRYEARWGLEGLRGNVEDPVWRLSKLAM